MRILLASPRGFCAGVVRAIGALQRALDTLGPPLYVYHEIVHNRWVVDRFRHQGVIFVDDLSDVPAGSNLLFSAHGVGPDVRKEAEQRNIRAIDATCPLVEKVHAEARRFARHGYTILLIGHAGHEEVVGTLAEVPSQMRLIQTLEDANEIEVPDPQRVAYLTQTTLSVDDVAKIVQRLRDRFPSIAGPAKDDICYATQNRQQAVRVLVGSADVTLVVGSKNSSNSNRLAELARQQGCRAYLVDGPDQIQEHWFQPTDTVLVTAGASAPEHLVVACVHLLQARFSATVSEHVVRRETVRFPLPTDLVTLECTAAAGSSGREQHQPTDSQPVSDRTD